MIKAICRLSPLINFPPLILISMLDIQYRYHFFSTFVSSKGSLKPNKVIHNPLSKSGCFCTYLKFHFFLFFLFFLIYRTQN